MREKLKFGKVPVGRVGRDVVTMRKTYKPLNFRGNYLNYARERDEHVYQLWEQGKTKDSIAAYICRSKERARQLVKEFEERARWEQAQRCEDSETF